MTTAARQLVENVLFTLIARSSMLLVAGIGLPVAGWLSLRVVSTQDSILNKIDKINAAIAEGKVSDALQAAELKSLSVSVAQSHAVMLEELKDHETRIRVLERAHEIKP